MSIYNNKYYIDNKYLMHFFETFTINQEFSEKQVQEIVNIFQVVKKEYFEKFQNETSQQLTELRGRLTPIELEQRLISTIALYAEKYGPQSDLPVLQTESAMQIENKHVMQETATSSLLNRIQSDVERREVSALLQSASQEEIKTVITYTNKCIAGMSNSEPFIGSFIHIALSTLRTPKSLEKSQEEMDDEEIWLATEPLKLKVHPYSENNKTVHEKQLETIRQKFKNVPVSRKAITVRVVKLFLAARQKIKPIQRKQYVLWIEMGIQLAEILEAVSMNRRIEIEEKMVNALCHSPTLRSLTLYSHISKILSYTKDLRLNQSPKNAIIENIFVPRVLALTEGEKNKITEALEQIKTEKKREKVAILTTRCLQHMKFSPNRGDLMAWIIKVISEMPDNRTQKNGSGSPYSVEEIKNLVSPPFYEQQFEKNEKEITDLFTGIPNNEEVKNYLIGYLQKETKNTESFRHKINTLKKCLLLTQIVLLVKHTDNPLAVQEMQQLVAQIFDPVRLSTVGNIFEQLKLIHQQVTSVSLEDQKMKVEKQSQMTEEKETGQTSLQLAHNLDNMACEISFPKAELMDYQSRQAINQVLAQISDEQRRGEIRSYVSQILKDLIKDHGSFQVTEKAGPIVLWLIRTVQHILDNKNMNKNDHSRTNYNLEEIRKIVVPALFNEAQLLSHKKEILELFQDTPTNPNISSFLSSYFFMMSQTKANPQLRKWPTKFSLLQKALILAELALYLPENQQQTMPQIFKNIVVTQTNSIVNALFRIMKKALPLHRTTLKKPLKQQKKDIVQYEALQVGNMQDSQEQSSKLQKNMENNHANDSQIIGEQKEPIDVNNIDIYFFDNDNMEEEKGSPSNTMY